MIVFLVGIGTIVHLCNNDPDEQNQLIDQENVLEWSINQGDTEPQNDGQIRPNQTTPSTEVSMRNVYIPQSGKIIIFFHKCLLTTGGRAVYVKGDKAVSSILNPVFIFSVKLTEG